MSRLTLVLLLAGCLLLPACSPTAETTTRNEPARDSVAAIAPPAVLPFKPLDSLKVKLPFPVPKGTKLLKATADTLQQKITLALSAEFSYQPVREVTIEEVYGLLREFLGSGYRGYTLEVTCMGKEITRLIPNFALKPEHYDSTKLPPADRLLAAPVVRKERELYPLSMGLRGRNIVLWPSHGWYFSQGSKRWEWQRPRLFRSVEDKIPLSFVLPYLVPMLENAGANVFLPRERDTQLNEVVVDNDSPTDLHQKRYQENNFKGKGRWKQHTLPGFGYGTPPYRERDNPFTQGSSRFTETDTAGTATVTWKPEIPETGNYGVTIAYSSLPNSVTDARYTVYHAGGSTTMLVNQSVGGGTWIYLGNFYFKKGDANNRLVLSNKSKQRGVVSADAARFGGGMGLVARNGATSGRPKYLEAARYYLQYAGMPDTLVYDLNNNKNDYNDDYQCRSEYGNYLNGAPAGPNRNRTAKGLGIPIDLSLAFHTDAGIASGDTTIGTLAIYSVQDYDSNLVFADGSSRWANRDLADLVQSQILFDIHKLHDASWNRRQLREAQYSESVRPNYPSMLLELLSHQNQRDMEFFQDPAFRFTVARAIYKGILKFITTQHNLPFKAQPVPVKMFSTSFDADGNIQLRWKRESDPTEPTSTAEGYIVYTRENDGGFDNGTFTDEFTYTQRNPKPGTIYSFKVCAVNRGGESFPSEILSACKTQQPKGTALIINAFNRVSGPATVRGTQFSGFAGFLDQGVADRYDLSYTGEQTDFTPSSAFMNNDAPGHGASSADAETSIIPGNTFDFTVTHGIALRQAGYSFVSASDESITENTPLAYDVADLLLGEEKTTQPPGGKPAKYSIYPKNIQAWVSNYLGNGGKLFISGAYTGTDLAAGDSIKQQFARNWLKYAPSANHASTNGQLLPADTKTIFTPLHITTSQNPQHYAVEAPDALAPEKGAEILLRYQQNYFAAAIGYRKQYAVLTTGFPFEAISTQTQRNTFMQQVLRYLKKQP